MLLARFQLINGYSCVEIPGHVGRDGNESLYTQMSYLGYKDSIAEMALIVQEAYPRSFEPSLVLVDKHDLILAAQRLELSSEPL